MIRPLLFGMLVGYCITLLFSFKEIFTSQELLIREFEIVMPKRYQKPMIYRIMLLIFAFIYPFLLLRDWIKEKLC